MEPANKKPKISEDPDENCRLRNGLNIHFLVLIFKNLNIQDLYTLGGMNEFYKQIINDSVIINYNVNFMQIMRDYDISQFFQRHGSKIRKIS